ncbi:MAG: ACP S-malonyltransferase, partial [Lachnospiraceae bacterium]|nr:ACP S-malonyltransferase [Lachnospiraceae bacterium]
MAAILGMTGEAIENVINDMQGVTIANYNCPGQIVITGKAQAVEVAMEKLKEQGAKRTMLLKVSGPFHSPLLKDAGQELSEILAGIKLTNLRIPYVTNVTATYINDINETKELLATQVAASVRWMQSIEEMIANGVDTFVEIGPGKTLTGFMKKINKEMKVYNIEKWEDIEKVVTELA